MIMETINDNVFTYVERVITLRLSRDVKHYIAYSFIPNAKYCYLSYVKDSDLIRHSLATEPTSSSSFWQYMYCKHIRDSRLMYTALLKKPLTNAVCDAIYHYCLEVKDRKLLWQRLVHSNNPYYQYLYCLNVKDRREMWTALVCSLHIDAPKHQYLYCKYVKDREEMWKALISHNRTDYDYKIALDNYIRTCAPRPEVIDKLVYVEEMLELKKKEPCHINVSITTAES